MGARALVAGRDVIARRGVDTVAAPAVEGRAPRQFGGGVMQLLNTKDKQALNKIKKDVVAMTDPKARWNAIKAALDTLNTGTESNVRDGVKHLGVEVEKPESDAPVVTAKLVKKRSADDVWDHLTKGGTHPVALRRGTTRSRARARSRGVREEDDARLRLLQAGSPTHRRSLQGQAEGKHLLSRRLVTRGHPRSNRVRSARRELYEVVTPAKGKGMKLFKNADSFFPYFD